MFYSSTTMEFWANRHEPEVVVRTEEVMSAHQPATSMKIRGHRGLQELFTITSSIKAFLGPVKSYKFIFDEDTHESILTSSAYRLLQSLPIKTAIGQLLNETVQAHYKIYRTTTTTLFFMVGVWSGAVLDCVHQGIPISVIVSVMLDGLNACIEEVQSLQVPLSNIVITNDCRNEKSCSREGLHFTDLTNQGECSSEVDNHLLARVCNLTVASATNLKKCLQRKRLFHSRHIVQEQVSLSDHSTGSQKPVHNQTLGNLANGLSHGKQHIMQLVDNAVNLHCEKHKESLKDKNNFLAFKLETCCLQGVSDEHTRVSFGYTTLVSSENASVVKHLHEKPQRVLLIDGSLTERYRHLGFNSSMNIKKVSEKASNDIGKLEDSWTTVAYRKITRARVNVILVRENVCPILLRKCVNENILVVTQVKQNILQEFSQCTGAEPLAYLTQIDYCCIGSDVFVSLCTSGNSVIEAGQKIAISITAKNLKLVTVMLSCRLASRMQSIEDQFWTCAYRLHHAICDQNVFYGGGAVELLCLSHLLKLEHDALWPENTAGQKQFQNQSSWMAESTTLYKADILKCLSKGWYKYLSVLLCNAGQCFSELDAMTFIENELQNIRCHTLPIEYIRNEFSKKVMFINSMGISVTDKYMPVYDNVIPKMEAWRRALHLVLTVLQTDSEIITNYEAHKHTYLSDVSEVEYL
ncbi:hypothetical protein GDO86_000660 [Hymenochirus boettgeri]|uniref:Bardet-Biedl syndrome 12 n=1 Tax=Hymenochirus boettgeri TaxID=247094 RepID=A0A8T2KCJ9_9PIPI|nr:hypothetical protein GDO86_000660 [Hymenochirus boettgeri]